MDLRILGLIPARGGSKGVPQKNTKRLGGIPLIGYSIAAGIESGFISTVAVSTDDQSIAEISRSLGADVPFMRPTNLADDKSPTIDTVIHAIEFYSSINEPFDAICLLQPTVPFRNSSDLDGAINKFVNSGADSLVSVREVPHHYNPHWCFEENESGLLSIATAESNIIPRRQELPKAYHRDGSIYITKTSTVLEKKSLYGDSIAYYENVNTPYLNIDTSEDWEAAQRYLAENEG